MIYFLLKKITDFLSFYFFCRFNKNIFKENTLPISKLFLQITKKMYEKFVFIASYGC
jgi:hypothetical protein